LALLRLSGWADITKCFKRQLSPANQNGKIDCRSPEVLQNLCGFYGFLFNAGHCDRLGNRCIRRKISKSLMMEGLHPMSEETFADNRPIDRGVETTQNTSLDSKSSPLQLKQTLQQIIDFSTQALANANDIFQSYSPLLGALGWVLLAGIVSKLLLAILDAINDIPLFSTLVELAGFGCTDWFIVRYLIKAVDRQELSEKIEQIKQEVLGETAISNF
jgi:CAAD domains of cyanobacterial aminoacyl-tRNA synthetase